MNLESQTPDKVPKTNLINSCPTCGSSHVNPRERTNDYICYKCKATFKEPTERPKERSNTKPWSHQKELKKEDIPSIQVVKEMALSITDIRLRALFVLAYLTAGRISELTKDKKQETYMRKKDLSISELEDGRKVLLIHMPNRKNRKTKFKDIGIPFDTNEDFVRMIGSYTNSLGPLDTLFPISPSRAYYLLKDKLNINPHYLRHIRITHLVRDYKDISPFEIEMIAGWSNIMPIESYKHLKWKDAAKKL